MDLTQLPDRIRLPFDFDAHRLQEDVNSVEQLGWIEHFIRQNYRGDWSVIPLTAQRGRDHPIMMASAVPGNRDFIPTYFMDSCPYIAELLKSFATKLNSVRIMKLAANSEIKEHRDFDLDIDEVRIHIPIATNDQVHFYVNKERVVMNEGECWYLRLSDPHRVENNGDEDRIHLVIDMDLNSWMESIIRESAIVR